MVESRELHVGSFQQQRLIQKGGFKVKKSSP